MRGIMADFGTVLIADDDHVFRRGLARFLTAQGFSVREASNVDQALAQIDSLGERPHAVVDLLLGADSGLDVIAQLKQRIPKIRIVLVSGYCSIATTVEAMGIGAADCVLKNCGGDAIFGALIGSQRSPAYTPKPPSLAQVEWEHIQNVLRLCAGNVSETARVLNIPRRSLQRKLRRYAPIALAPKKVP